MRLSTALAALPVVVAAAALGVAASVTPSSTSSDEAPSTVPVTQTTVACPLIVGKNDVALGQVVARTDARTAARLRPGSTNLEDLVGAPGWRQQQLAPTDPASAVVRRVDPRGAGTVAFVAQDASTKLGGGLALAQCADAVPDAWFVGAGSTAKHASTLRLTNLGDSQALVDIELYGVDGSVEVPAGKGLALAPQEVRSIDLADIAEGESELAVRVVSRRGAVASALFDVSSSVFRGTDWNGPAVAPARSVTIPGVPAGATGRTLLVTNPGTDSATLAVNVAGDAGTAVPQGLEAVSVPAGSIKAIPLPASAGAGPLSLRLDASAPVVASVRASPSNVDFSYTAASAPVRGRTVVPLTIGADVVPGRVRVALIPASADAATSVSVEAFDASLRSLGTTTVDVAAGVTTTFDPSTRDLFSSADVAFVVLAPKAPVYAAMSVGTTAKVSALALRDAPLEVLAPRVRSVG